MRAPMVGLLTVALLLPLVVALPKAEATNCEFTLGFRALRDLIPNVVGECRVSEHHNSLNGDGLQETTGVDGKGGLLVWRKADNWTAYTDGFRTWINGPTGLQQRLNTERFPWEKDIVPPPAPQPGSIEWSLHEDGEKSFKYPVGWQAKTERAWYEYITHNFYESPDGKAVIYFVAPFKSGANYRVEDLITRNTKTWTSRGHFILLGPQERTTIGGHPAVVQWYEFTGKDPSRGICAAIQYGDQTHYISGNAATTVWAEYETILLEAIRSYTPK